MRMRASRTRPSAILPSTTAAANEAITSCCVSAVCETSSVSTPHGDGTHRGIPAAKVLGDCLHFHAVAHTDSTETEFSAQQIDRGHAHGRWCARVKRIEDDMGSHYARHPRLDRGDEGHELASAQALKAVREPRQVVVRVLVGVAVARKVLGAGGKFTFDSLDHGAAQCGNHLWIARKRAFTDHGIRGIRIDIDYGREVDVKASIAHLRTEALTDGAHFVDAERAHVAQRGNRSNPSVRRATRPPSWSTESKSGPGAMALSSRISARVSSRVPTLRAKRITPETP